MMPIQLGFKMYTNSKENGVYIRPLIGVHKVSATKPSYTFLGITIPEETASYTRASYGLGLGYVANKKIDVEIRYNLVNQNDGTIDYIGIRVAYNFL